MKVVKTFEQFINEDGNFFVPANTGGVSTNYKEDQTSLKQAYPDAETADDNDAWNPSIINKNAEEGPNKDVAFISRKEKTKGNSIDTFSNRTKEDRPGGGSIYGQSGVAESTELEVGIEVEMEHTDNRKEAEKIAKDHISEDPKYYSKLYKAGLIDEPKAEKLAKELDEGGLGDNQVAGQRVYTQNTDTSKQGYQDAMYYGDDEIDDHGPDCDCDICIEKQA